MKWYQYTPSDTLFLRGAEPLTAGMDFEVPSVFPPAVSVISGAIRTAVLSQRDVTLATYKQGVAELESLIGLYGDEAPFTVSAVFIEKGGRIYAPVPCSWMTESQESCTGINVVQPLELPAAARNHMGICGSAEHVYWGKHHNNLRSLGGNWITLEALAAQKKKLTTDTDILIGNSSFVSQEERTGIALDQHRRVKESQLYTARHLRLNDDCSIIWAIDRDTGLAKEGILSLGGEQRFGYYREREPVALPAGNGTQFMATTPTPVRDVPEADVIASGKLQYRGGWDLSRQFHKDMIAFYPAGTVFGRKVTSSCISF